MIVRRRGAGIFIRGPDTPAIGRDRDFRPYIGEARNTFEQRARGDIEFARFHRIKW
jgi:hypothetical protein